MGGTVASSVSSVEPVADPVTLEWAAFLAWLDSKLLSNDIEPGVSYAQLLRALESPRIGNELWVDFQRLYAEATGTTPAVEPPPAELPLARDDYETWTLEQRAAANAESLGVLRRIQQENRRATDEERAYLVAYTGDPGMVPSPLPMRFYTAAWALARRLAPFPIVNALDPTAGMARFVQASPGMGIGVDWSLVESDLTTSEMLAAIYPTAAEVRLADSPHSIAKFYDAAVAAKKQYDLVFVHPPSADRNDDYHRDEWYYLDQCTALLQPGGLMLAVLPSDLLFDSEDNAVEARRDLLYWHHFFGAVGLPGGLTLALWLKRSLTESVPTEYEQRVIQGERVSTSIRTLDTWDDVAIVNAPMQPVPLVTLNAIRTWRSGQVDTTSATSGVTGLAPASPTSAAAALAAIPDDDIKGAAVSFTTITDPALPESIFMSYRIQRFQALLGKGPEGRARAESGRAELLTDIEEYLTRFGNPHTRLELKGRAGVRALLAAIRANGTLATMLLTPSAAFGFDSPPAGASITEVVRWYSNRNGYCTVRDVQMHHEIDGDPLVDFVSDDPGLAIEWSLEGEPRFYAMSDYVVGAGRYERFALVDSALRSDFATDELRGKLEAQKQALIEAIDVQSLSEVTVTPRSGFVSLECLQAYVNERLANNPPAWGKNSSTANVVLRIEQGMLRASAGSTADDVTVGTFSDALVLDVQREWFRLVLGYWNRQIEVTDPEEKEARKFSIFETTDASKKTGKMVTRSLDLKERIQRFKDLESDFETWLAGNDHWQALTEDAYNRAHRDYTPREFSGDDLGLCRMFGGSMTPRGHQNAWARRFVDSYGGLIAGGVGSGKTLGGITTFALARQQGKARRGIVVVPSSVMFQWRDALRRCLPDYRVGIIGFHFNGEQFVKDTANDRQEKWKRFSEGGYELMICPYQNFQDDLALGDAEMLDTLRDQHWLQREVGVEEEDRRLAQRRITAGEAALEEDRQVLVDAKAELEHRQLREWGNAPMKAYEKTVNAAKKRMEAMLERIVRWTRTIESPSESIIRLVEADVDGADNKPFRPRVKTAREWQPGWKKEELIKFAQDQGLVIYTDGSVDRDSALRLADGDDEVATRYLRFDFKAPAVQRKGVPKTRIVEILQFFFPPESGPARPRPALAQFEDLGCDFLIVDEAHNFKNIWGPFSRYGLSKISYMGPIGISFGPRTWDMFTKCQYTNRLRGGGVLLLTATPIKNSPIEVYNLAALAKADLWASYRIRDAEEFIDRYCGFDHQFVPTVERTLAPALVMSKFTGLGEMKDIMARVFDRKTIDDLLALGVIKSVPVAPKEDVFVPLDERQTLIYKTIREEIKAEIAVAKASGDAGMSGGMLLVQMDMLSKVALDPRLLVEDVRELRKILTDHGVIQDPNRDPSLPPPPTVQETYAKWEREGGKEPKAPLDAQTLLFLGKRYALLLRLKIEQIGDEYTNEGIILPKYAALSEFILENSRCGHIVFSDFNDTHEWIADAIVAIVGGDESGIPRERIKILSSDLKPDERQEVAEEFNGKSREVDLDTGREIQAEVAPRYDVIIGNSAVMAEGIDLQRRTCAIHHLNFPWEPATITQRNGRAVRQGNTLEEVRVRYYSAERSFDLIKLNMVWAKGDWQKTLFAAGTRQSMDNPAMGGISREEANILVTVDDPKEAELLLEEMRAAQKIKEWESALDEAKRALVTLVTVYAKARANTDPSARRALFAKGDVIAERMRAMSDKVLPDKNVIATAREHVVYYDFTTGFTFHEGERVCVQSANPADRTPAGWGRPATVPVKLEITKISPQGTFFLARRFGTAAVQNMLKPLDLLGTRALGPVEKLDIEVCGGWDVEQDAEDILASVVGTRSLPGMPREMLDRLSTRLWPSLFNAAVTRNSARLIVDPRETGFAPLYKQDAPGEILLLPYGTVEWYMNTDRESDLRKLAVDDYTLLLPWTKDGWGRFADAVQKDKIRVLTPTGPEPLNKLKYGQEMNTLARVWFGRLEGINPKMLTAMDKAREAREAKEEAKRVKALAREAETGEDEGVED